MRLEQAASVIGGKTKSLNLGSLSRSVFFGSLVAVGFLNGISEKVHRSVAEHGLKTAIAQTFDISVILWGACIAALATLASKRTSDPFRRSDYAIAVLAGTTFLVPVPAMSWLGLCLIAVHLQTTTMDPVTRRAAAIIFAITIPLFWARLLLAAFSEAILHADAVLVGWLIGTRAADNVVPFADGSGFMAIAPGCSSFSNLSLAILSAIVFVNLRSGLWSRSTLGWTSVSAAAVVAINLGRISLIGVYPEYFELIHGSVGATLANCLSLITIVVIGYQKIGYDELAGS